MLYHLSRLNATGTIAAILVRSSPSLREILSVAWEIIMDINRCFGGTPDRILHEEDLPSTTVCSRVFKKAAVQSNKGPFMPKNRSFPNKRSWGTVSKPFEKSRIATSVWILRSLASSRSWSVTSNWVSQENVARKPWFSVVKVPYCSKCVL